MVFIYLQLIWEQNKWAENNKGRDISLQTYASIMESDKGYFWENYFLDMKIRN